jgi:putative aminopeptidase FrvX
MIHPDQLNVLSKQMRNREQQKRWLTGQSIPEQTWFLSVISEPVLNLSSSCYLDNRLGVYIALQLASTLRNGAMVFSCWEEHGGGTAGYLAGYLYRNYNIRQALICDITWVTEGVHHGKGVAVSMRDAGIPRRVFVERIRKILSDHNVIYQLEVESAGGSDGSEIQKSPFPVDWCFVGAPEDGVHSPDEKVHTSDIESMLKAYRVLMENL